MNAVLKAALALFLVLASSTARAEVTYVSEGVQVGVHQDASLTSTILALVPAGTPLEVLERRSGMVSVRLTDGTEGWVDERYLGDDISPSRKTDGLEAELVQTATELAKARELAAELEFQLNRERERAKIMEADLLKARKELENTASKDGNAAAASADTIRQLRQVTEENRRMRKRVGDLEARLEAAASESGESPVVIIERPASTDDEASLMTRYTAITGWQVWKIMLLLFGLLLAFAVGGYVVDWEVRRRHGGFRV